MRFHFTDGSAERCTDSVCAHTFHYATQKDALAEWDSVAFFASHFQFTPEEPHLCF